jgi:hypothetical protein
MILTALISSGAPDDEDEPEVERIVTALENLSREQASVTAIADIFAASGRRCMEGQKNRCEDDVSTSMRLPRK